jgi:hypothetical protein
MTATSFCIFLDKRRIYEKAGSMGQGEGGRLFGLARRLAIGRAGKAWFYCCSQARFFAELLFQIIELE